MRVGEQSTDPIDQVLGEVPVPASLTPEDVRLAVRAVVVHAAEEWPNGPLCRNDGASYPCRLHRWGRRVLENHGLNDRQIDALIRHGNPFVHVPFPFTYTTPGPVRRLPGPPRPPATRRGARWFGRARPGAAHRHRDAARDARRCPRPAGGAPAAAPRWPRAS